MSTTNPAPVSLSKLSDDLHTALRLWHRDDSDASPLDYLLLYRQRRSQVGSSRQATNEILHEGLASLALRFPDSAAMLRVRFLDHQLAHAVANQLNVAESTVYALQKEALDRLAEAVLRLEQQSRATRQGRVESRLEPPSHGELVGIDRHLENLSRTLVTAGPPYLISVEGIGGIGKSALADALVRQVAGDTTFEDFGWVTARQMWFMGSIRTVARPALTTDALVEALLAQLMPDAQLADGRLPEQALAALHARLHQPHLVVIDNLETVQDIEHLLPLLRRLAGPSKFVLTSRQSLFFEPGLRHFVVPELTMVDAFTLLRREASLQCMAAIAQARDDELRQIYETVGGNPLALRLVIGMTCALSLDEVLTNLATARGRSAEHIYSYVFRSSWGSMDRTTQEVLLAMLLISPHGGTTEDIVAISGLDQGVTADALASLVAFNLVDCHGALHDRRYSIHQLTRRFLERQILEWPR